MDYSEKIFKILGVEPNERFKIKEVPNCLYAINEKLNVKVATEDDTNFWMHEIECLPALLNGTYTIKKIIKPSKIDQVAIDYAKVCGCNWLAKDKDGFVYAYSQKPKKLKYAWRADNCSNEVQEKITFVEIYMPVSFLSWEDDEPYYIGD